MNKVNFIKCDDSDDGTDNQKVYQEPIYTELLGWERWYANH